MLVGELREQRGVLRSGSRHVVDDGGLRRRHGIHALAPSGNGFSLAHQYVVSGRHGVLVRVTDDDGGVGRNSAEVRVLTPQEGVGVLAADVEALAAALGLTKGELTALMATLGPAVRHLNERQTIPARNQLNAFIHKVAALVQSGRITAAEGASLSAYAGRILRSMQWL
jgi:hypothetical protein